MNQLAGLEDSDGDDYPDYYDYYPNDATKHDDSLSWRDIYFSTEGDYVGGFSQWYIDEGHANIYDPSEVGEDPLSGVAIDVTYYLTEKITLYSQFGKLIGKIQNSPDGDEELGRGLVPIGVNTQFGPLKFQSEYRIGSRKFLFNYWDRSYDLNRAIVSNDTTMTRESQLFKYGKLNGFNLNVNIAMMNLFNMGIGYQNMNGEKWDKEVKKYITGKSNQTFSAFIGINSSLIPKVSKAEAFYQQSNIPDPFEFTPNPSTIMGYNVGIEMSSGVMVLYQARTTYISDLENPGDYLPVNSLQIETQFVL